MIEINNLTPKGIVSQITFKELRKAGEKVLKKEKIKGDLSVVFACQARMKSINKKYRGKDKATDVLSFGYKTKIQNPKLLDKELLGEIVICPDIVKKNAKKFDLDYNKELTRALIHGILHILGYDHEKSKKEAEEMRKKEEKYLSQLNF